MTRSRNLFAVVLTALVSPVVAGTINYAGPDSGPGGTNGWEGDNVWYLAVEESNTEGTGGDDGQTAPLFGAPQVVGDSIDFNPSNFVAQSQGGGSDTTTGDLKFMVLAKPGQVISNLQYAEAGDTTIAGSPSTDATFTRVTADVSVEVVDVDGSPLVSPVDLVGQLVFTPSDGDYELATDSGGGFFYQTDWTGSLMIDINAELTAEGVAFNAGATKVNVTVSNTLIAESIDGTSAFIKKKDFDSVSITANIPEPSTGLLLASGALGFARRRR